eukprot:9118426-Pyramimonas_sp.AAC.1
MRLANRGVARDICTIAIDWWAARRAAHCPRRRPWLPPFSVVAFGRLGEPFLWRFPFSRMRLANRSVARDMCTIGVDWRAARRAAHCPRRPRRGGERASGWHPKHMQWVSAADV